MESALSRGDIPYILMLYNSLESFGEVAVLLELADSLIPEYDCIFLSLERPDKRESVLQRMGYRNHYYLNEHGQPVSTVDKLIHDDPPALCIASDYSQFNVWCDHLPQTQMGERLMNSLSVRNDVRAAVMDLAGLSLEAKTPLRDTFSRILIPAGGYSKVAKHTKLPDARQRVICTEPKRSLDDNKRETLGNILFLSYPRPNGWSALDSGDPFSRLWIQAIEHALRQINGPLKLVMFEDLAEIFPTEYYVTSLRADATLSEVNEWLARVDKLITPNWCSTLAARARQHGAAVLVTYNDALREGYEHKRWRDIAGPEIVATITPDAFGQWLPHDFQSCWPGVEVGVTSMLQDAQAVPLFASAELAAQIVRFNQTRDIQSPIVPCKSPLEAVRELDLRAERTGARNA